MKTHLLVACGLTLMMAGAGSVPADAQVKTAPTVTGAKPKTFTSFDAAMAAGYAAREAGDLAVARDAFLAAVSMTDDSREKCNAHRVLVALHAETGDIDGMFESTEYIVENAPYPAFSSLTVRGMLSIAQSKGLKSSVQQRYDTQLAEDPNDRTALTIMEAFASSFTRDYAKRGEYIERLIELDRAEGKPVDIEMKINRAFCYKLNRDNVAAAEMYEVLAKEDEDFQSYCLMEAASCWQRAGNKEKALRAAYAADKLGPDKRARRSLYQWHRTLADLFLLHLQREPAIKHFEQALEEANIDAYRQQCEQQLKIAKALKETNLP